MIRVMRVIRGIRVMRVISLLGLLGKSNNSPRDIRTTGNRPDMSSNLSSKMPRSLTKVGG